MGCPYACVCGCVCKLTPAAGTGEAEPAGTGEAWRWDELACSLSHRGLDRKGLCRRPEPETHGTSKSRNPHKRMRVREKADRPQLSRGRRHGWDGVRWKIQATGTSAKAGRGEGGGDYLAGDWEEQRLSRWEWFPSLSAWTCLWGSQPAERWATPPPNNKRTTKTVRKRSSNRVCGLEKKKPTEGNNQIPSQRWGICTAVRAF